MLDREDLSNLGNERQLAVAHFIIGMIVIGLCVIEITLGIIVKQLIEKKDKFINNTNYKLIHKVIKEISCKKFNFYRLMEF